ncbi:MAG: EamA family transporter [Ignavibacteria bacterium]|nr:EamA family transporter [Ignavibacteria bacterium]
MSSHIPSHRKGLIYISFTAFLWSTSGFFIKYLTIDAFQISFYRSLVAAITVLAITLARKGKMKIEFDGVSNLAAVFYAGILILFVLATKMTTAANAIFLQFTAPIYLVVLEPIFLKTKFSPKNIITIFISIAGMILFFFGKLELGNIYGNLLAICSGICFAMFSLLLKYKRVKQKSENTLGTVVMGNALVAVLAFAVIFPNLGLNLTEALILLYMGAVQIGISYIIFNEGIKYVSATESMIIATLEAVFNPVWVFIGIGEAPSVYSIIGGSIIFGAIIWRNVSGKEKSLIIE